MKKLSDAERGGAPAKFSMEQVIELFALACSLPEDYGRPIDLSTKDKKLTLRALQELQLR
jgi:hypothetical protein